MYKLCNVSLPTNQRARLCGLLIWEQSWRQMKCHIHFAWITWGSIRGFAHSDPFYLTLWTKEPIKSVQILGQPRLWLVAHLQPTEIRPGEALTDYWGPIARSEQWDADGLGRFLYLFWGSSGRILFVLFSFLLSIHSVDWNGKKKKQKSEKRMFEVESDKAVLKKNNTNWVRIYVCGAIANAKYHQSTSYRHDPALVVCCLVFVSIKAPSFPSYLTSLPSVLYPYVVYLSIFGRYII